MAFIENVIIGGLECEEWLLFADSPEDWQGELEKPSTPMRGFA